MCKSKCSGNCGSCKNTGARTVEARVMRSNGVHYTTYATQDTVYVHHLPNYASGVTTEMSVSWLKRGLITAAYATLNAPEIKTVVFTSPDDKVWEYIDSLPLELNRVRRHEAAIKSDSLLSWARTELLTGGDVDG